MSLSVDRWVGVRGKVTAGHRFPQPCESLLEVADKSPQRVLGDSVSCQKLKRLGGTELIARPSYRGDCLGLHSPPLIPNLQSLCSEAGKRVCTKHLARPGLALSPGCQGDRAC